jgi:xanthine dehydrogenase YagR molybdenum-binding subunit
VARLIRTEKEVEGRYEEVWLVVEEDALEQWPAGAREIVGRPTTRLDGLERARGEAVYTADLKLPGLLHTAVLRSPYAHARVARIDLAPALASPGVHGAIGPGDIPQLEEECGFQGAAVAAVCADTSAQASAALAAIEIEWEQLEVLLDPDEAIARGEQLIEPRVAARGDYEQALAEADVVVEGEFRTQVVLHNSMETHQSVVQWIGDTLEIYISTQYIWGVRDEVASALGLPADKVRVVCHYMGGGFGSKNSADDYTFIAIELASRTHRPVRCALTRRQENLATGNRNATIQRLTIGAKSDGTLTALGGEFVNAVGWSGWTSPTEGPMQLLYACPNVKTTTWGGKDQPAADEGVPCARFRRGNVWRRVAARRACNEARHRSARAAPQELRPERSLG